MSLALAYTMFGTGIQPGFAQSTGVTVTDYYIMSGQEPWGITFDSKGNVWVAVPGCDPSPTCSSSTPLGKIEEYNPATSSWITTYQLPAGYAQPASTLALLARPFLQMPGKLAQPNHLAGWLRRQIAH